MKSQAWKILLCLSTLILITIIWSRPGIGEAASETYRSAKFCANCHQDIYSSWAKGMHANSLKDPIFEANFLMALRDGDGETRQYCLKCHAPTTQITKDFGLKLALSEEGINCDFCHTISAVDLNNREQPFTLAPGDTKYGPYSDAASSVHKTQYSELHLTSEFCGGCHELKAKNGLPIMETYSEWKKGPYSALGVTCQKCHMPVVKQAKIVLPEVKTSNKKVNTHNLLGGHSIDQLTSAAKVEIDAVTRQEEYLIVEVDVVNEGSGHMIPTGTPSRKLDLKVELKAGGKIMDSQMKSFQKVIVDSEGNKLWRDVDIMLKGERVVYDNRISPKEKRRQVFIFSNPGKKEFTVQATLTYSYQPMVIQISPMEINMHGDTKFISDSVIGKR